MKRNELEQKINKALVGKEIDYNMRLINMVRPLLDEWFDNEQGYYNLWIDNYTLTINYKGRRIVDLKVARQKVGDKFVIRRVSVEDDFVDSESVVEKIHQDNLKATTESWHFTEKRDYNRLMNFFRAVKQVEPNTKASDLMSIMWDLHHYFWLLEDTNNG